MSNSILPEDFPIYIMKFAEKKEYLDSLLEGHIYFKESGYFRKLEDNYRGDKYDGKIPIDIGNQEIYLEAEDGTRFDFSGRVRNFQAGFSGDDKIPIFCASLMDDAILEKTGECSARFRTEFVNELAKFGKYGVFIPLGEFIEKIEEVQKNNKNVAFLYGGVSYVDILEKYDTSYIDDESRSQYEPFFYKDKSYQWQNEWRVVLVSSPKLIAEEQDSFVMEVTPFQYAMAFETKTLTDSELHWSESAEE